MYTWQIRPLHAKIVTQLLFSMKVNKHFTKRKGSKTNHKDALIAEQQKNNNKEEITAVAAETEASAAERSF
jgi:hypothetical protein